MQRISSALSRCLGKGESLIGEALSRKSVKKEKRAYITNDNQGNLFTYQDPAAAAKGQKDTFTYNNTHGLLSIKDPLGHTPLRTDYDASGRMTDTVDAFGNKITYAYNLAANSESVTNRNNQPTSYLYDNNGNVLQKTEFLNGAAQVTRYTYSQDGFNNKTSETLPGPGQQPTNYIYGDTNNPRLVTQQTDPLGHSTSYTYDSLGHVLTSIDARNIQTTNTYSNDGHFNLSTSQVAGFPPTTYSYDANGNLIKAVDPANIETDYAYDSFGNQSAVTVAPGVPEQSAVNYAYDGNGNRVTETRFDTHSTSGQTSFTTGYQYDGRSIKIFKSQFSPDPV